MDFAAAFARGVEVRPVNDAVAVKVAAVPRPDAEVAFERTEAVVDDLHRRLARFAERACARNAHPLARARTRTRY